MAFRNDPDGTRLPIKVDPTSNGEFVPGTHDSIAKPRHHPPFGAEGMIPHCNS